MSDDREHIRQQRRAEREKKEREFQEEMERWEAERLARAEARKKAKEAESTPAPAPATSTPTTSSDASGTRRTLRRTETQKAIEQNLDDWEADRKDRLAEREREAQERKAALEAQLAAEEKERQARAEARRKQRELERQQEEAEEAARKAKLEERRAAREAQRIAEEKEYEEKQAARRRAREERDRSSSQSEHLPSSLSSSSGSVGSNKKDKKDKKDKDKDKKKDARSTSSTPEPVTPTSSTSAAAAAKTTLDNEILREYSAWGTSSTGSSGSSTTDKPSTSTYGTGTASSSSGHGFTISAPIAVPTPVVGIARPDSPTSSPNQAPVGLLSSSGGLAVPRPDSPQTRTESPARRKRLGELGRSSDASKPNFETPMTPTSSSSAELDQAEAEERKKAQAAEEKRKKEAMEDAALKAAADAELAQQAAQDAAIREEMRKEEAAQVAKEKAAEAKKVAALAKPSQASKFRSLVGQARSSQQNRSRITTTERPIAHVPAPVTHRLTVMELFSVGGGGGAKRLPDPDLLMNHFVREGRLAKDCVTEILLQARTAFLYEKNVVTTNGPAYVIGDIHGQFYDLLHLFKQIGLPGQGDSNFIFLGDYVDRGTFSCEVCLILFVCKLRYGSKVTLLRGNHETRAMSSYHNFQQEATHKYGAAVYEMFMEVFDHLPLGAIIETGGSLGRVFCCHGGLSPAFKTIDELQELDRVAEPSDEGAVCDLIWADPVEDDKFFNQNFSRNKERGCSVVFGYNPIYDFLDMNNFAFIVRAHQVEEKGYRELHFSQAPPGRVHPMVITLFSAPNYCDSYENMAAYLSVSADEYNFHQYSWQSHPYCLPEFSNAFKFSLPFVAENIMKFIVGIVETIHGTDVDVEDEDASEDDEASASLEAKLKLVGKSFIMLKKMRETSMSKLGNIVEQLQKAQQQPSLVSGDTQLMIDQARSKGGRRKVQRVVSDLSDIVKMAHDRFKAAKDADRDNERFHGRVLWKSTFRKLGRGVSFKV